MGDVGNVFSAFGEEHVVRLTGVSKRQLRYWDQTGLFVPSYSREARRDFGRIYSFHDVVALKVLHALRNQFKVPLQHLRLVSERLEHLESSRWTGVRLYVLGRKVIWHEPATALPQEVASQQYVVPCMDLQAVVTETKDDISAMRSRLPSEIGKLHKTRKVNRNALVVAGTRIPVRAVKGFIDAGYSNKQILEEYPDLVPADVEAVRQLDIERAAA